MAVVDAVHALEELHALLQRHPELAAAALPNLPARVLALVDELHGLATFCGHCGEPTTGESICRSCQLQAEQAKAAEAEEKPEVICAHCEHPAAAHGPDGGRCWVDCDEVFACGCAVLRVAP